MSAQNPIIITILECLKYILECIINLLKKGVN